MGLSLEVGILADLNENDEEGAEHFREEFATLNRFLQSQGWPPHIEPESSEVWSAAMWGYSGLHHLRRVAAHIDLRARLPEPGDINSAKDATLEEYFRLTERGPRSFDHLIVHSDAEGYYLPRDFKTVLILPEKYPIAGGMVGSSIRLQQECERLAQALSLPLETDPESDEVVDAAEAQGKGVGTWQRYGIESYTCLQLRLAAVNSIRSGAAVVFT